MDGKLFVDCASLCCRNLKTQKTSFKFSDFILSFLVEGRTVGKSELIFEVMGKSDQNRKTSLVIFE